VAPTPTDRLKRPTQADVARLAAVSQPVVSYVLRGQPLPPVAPATRRLVLAAIEQLGYVPNRAARSLRTRQMLTIAAIIPDITNPFYPAFVRGIQDVAGQHGYDLISYNTDGDPATERKVLRSAGQGRVDGIVITPFHVTADDLRPLLDASVAVAVLGTPEFDPAALPLDLLSFDNAAAARTAVDYLIGRGHTRIGMIAGQAGTPPREGRVLGYKQAIAVAGLPLDRFLIRGGQFTESGGYATMRELFTFRRRPTAVFAANDLMALGALIALREAGLGVPRDMAIVGLDDIPAAKLVNPPLTTVAQFPERIGRRAATLLFERLRGEAPAGGRREEMAFELIVRESA
jgi:LacI family transcriptional regulator